MALRKFLRPANDDSGFHQTPKPLLKVVNAEYGELCDTSTQGNGKRRGMYQRFPDEERATIRKFASEHGVASASRKYDIAESSFRDWRDLYRRELTIKSKEVKVGEEICIDALLSKKRGKPPLLGEKFDCHLQEKILAMRSRGTPIGTSVVIGIGTGILMKHKKATASSFKLTKEWAKSVLRWMGYTKRKANSKCKVNLINFDKIKQQYLLDIRAAVEMEDIPPSLVKNWDHTATKIVPSSQWTMERKGMKRVEIATVDDKRQITAIFACTLSGKFLPIQLIYQGTTPKCLPKNVNFPSDWHLTYTANHWANEETSMAYIDNIILPFVLKERASLDLHCALVLFDVFKGQCTSKVLKKLEDNNIL